MGFSQAIRDEIFTRSARHCCVCHQFKGINLEIHHIQPRHLGGKDSLENAICLCFDCHADAGHYFAGHPKGSRLAPSELLQHKEVWFAIVKENKIQAPRSAPVEVTILNEDFSGVFSPVFIKERTTFFDRNFYKDTYKMLGMDVEDMVRKFKQNPINADPSIRRYVNKINDYDGLIDFLNGDGVPKDPESASWNCQPIRHHFGPFRTYKEINRSTCVLWLQLTNPGPIVLEDFKLKMRWEKVIAVDTVTKQTSALDLGTYTYNIDFLVPFQAEFWPDRNVLVQRDSVRLDPICFIPEYRTRYVQIHWELLARDVYHSGKLTLLIKPTYEKRGRTQFKAHLPDVEKVTRYLPKIDID